MAEYNRGSGIRRHDFRGPKRRDAEQGREVRERYETDRDLAEDQYYDQGTMSSEAPKQQQGRSGAGTRNRPDAGRRDGYGMGRDRRERPRAPRQRGPPGSRTEEDRDGGAGYGLANTSPSHVHMRGQYGRRDRYEPDQRYSERKVKLSSQLTSFARMFALAPWLLMLFLLLLVFFSFFHVAFLLQADIPERVANRVLGVERREMRRRQREEEEEVCEPYKGVGI